MSLLTTNVTSNYVDPSSTPLGGVPVVATLMGSRFTISGTTVNREEKTYTQSIDPYVEYAVTPIVGKWTLSLLPNALFGEDSYYLIRVGAKEEYEVVVPVTVGDTPVEMNTILKQDSVIVPRVVFVGILKLTGTLVVDGNISVSGVLDSAENFERVTINPDDLPNISGNLEIVGNLIVSGTVSATGTITVGV